MAEQEVAVRRLLVLSESQKKLIKESVSENLLRFLAHPLPPDDTINVLSEYIIVLISNGKSQNQAARELEPFFRERSMEFVSWLWDFISENVENSTATTGASDIQNFAGVISSDNNTTKNKQACEPAHSLVDDEEVSECLQGSHMFSLLTSYEDDIEDSMLKNDISLERKFHSSENEHNESLNCSSQERSPDGSEKSMQHKKVHQRSAHFKCSLAENVAGRRLFSRAAGAILNQHAKLHQTNVWDRLGRLSEPRNCVNVNLNDVENTERETLRLFSRAAGATVNQHAKLHQTNVWDRLGRLSEPRNCVNVNLNDVENTERETLKHNWRCNEHNKFLQSLKERKYCSRLSENLDIKPKGSGVDRKRQFSDLNPHSAGISYSVADERSSEYRALLPEKDNNALFENAVYSQAERLKSQNYGSTSDASTSSRSNKIPQEKLTAGSSDYTEGPISAVVPLTAKQTSKGDGNIATGGINPMQAQLMDMKLKLHQMETEILRLQENVKGQDQSLLFSSSKKTKCSFFGHSQEDAESRTVVVTNVHVAATREAIMSYFSKCGAVARVIKLNDIATRMGSAYVTFASKDSADKALALNGTLFFTRTIRVKRAGKPVSTSRREQRS